MDMLVIGIGFIQSLFIGWVIVGFIISMKVLFLDGGNDRYDEAVGNFLVRNEEKQNKLGITIGKAINHRKWVFVVACCLLGLFALHIYLEAYQLSRR